MKKLFILFGVVVAVLGVFVLIAAKVRQNSAPAGSEPIKIAVSFYPLAEFAQNVGGEKVSVVNIVPSGVEPHDFEPTPQDIAKVYSSQIFVYNGSGFDPWAEKIAPELEKRGVSIVNMTKQFNLLEGTNEHAEKFDPHIWLDPVLAKKEVEIIRDMLKSVDPENAAVYDMNAGQYIKKLSGLDEKYKSGLGSCEIRDAVASHAAFGYLSKRYNLNVVNIAGLSPEEEPSPKKIAEIAKFVRSKNIKYIFFETLVSPKIAETIAREAGAETLVFNPIEGLTEGDLASGKNYISLMEENLVNLRKALLCQ